MASSMTTSRLYKVTFLNTGKIYEIYARRVSSSTLWGFTEVADLQFEEAGLLVDPAEERLRTEFRETRALHLPMQAIVRIEEVERRGQSVIRDAATGERVVTPFPMPGASR
jgi:hypothetical protein